MIWLFRPNENDLYVMPTAVLNEEMLQFHQKRFVLILINCNFYNPSLTLWEVIIISTNNHNWNIKMHKVAHGKSNRFEMFYLYFKITVFRLWHLQVSTRSQADANSTVFLIVGCHCWDDRQKKKILSVTLIPTGI